ncbi:MAG TPA: hypothetical protein VM364_20865 [Vicinamibacterales bacterium]|nr:hypothetical protein [Vicinamibacterales bacterium]
MSRLTPVLAAVAVICLGADAVAQPGPPGPVSVRATLDRTAMWVGDRVGYTIELVTDAGVDILLDDLAADRLIIEGGEILESGTEEEARGTRRVRRVRHTVTAFGIDTPAVRIPAFSVRYFSSAAVAGGAGAAPAGQVVVPPAVIAVRSTLPDGPRLPDLREPVALPAAAGYAGVARPVGLVLVAVAAVPVVFVAIGAGSALRRLWARRGTVRPRRRRNAAVELRALAPVSPADHAAAYERLDALVREHLQLVTGIPATALTPAEVRRALEARTPSRPHEEVETLLELCERWRYAPDPPASSPWSDAVRRAEAILRRRR